MSPEDIGRVASRSLFLSLEHTASPRLIKFFYVIGLAAIAMWAIRHFFYAFAFGFAEGLWGLLEIFVVGLFMITGLRIACEAGIVFFKANKPAASKTAATAAHTSLMEEVRGAIEDLAGEDEYETQPSSGTATTRTSGGTTAKAAAPIKGSAPERAEAAAQASPAKGGAASSTPSGARKPTRRTAKRTPPGAKPSGETQS